MPPFFAMRVVTDISYMFRIGVSKQEYTLCSFSWNCLFCFKNHADVNRWMDGFCLVVEYHPEDLLPMGLPHLIYSLLVGIVHLLVGKQLALCFRQLKFGLHVFYGISYFIYKYDYLFKSSHNEKWWITNGFSLPSNRVLLKWVGSNGANLFSLFIYI